MVRHLIAVLTLGWGLSACAQNTQYLVRGTDRSVGIDGVITIQPQSEDVNLVEVELVNLPPPERHDRDRTAFVVWLTPLDGIPIRAGRLAYDADSRAGSLSATTPNDQVFVQVTAEEISSVETPSDFVLVSKHVALTRGEEVAGGL